MIQTFIFSILKRRHFWRYASFDEVASLYAARFMRQTATFLVNIFVIVYIYQAGYTIKQIALFYICYFLYKMVIGYFVARYVAHFGPKHSMFVANILNIPALLAFSLLESYDIVALVAFLIFQGSSVTLYTQAHNIDFSKVKSTKRAGSEIGTMYIIDKFTAGVSPLLGGLLAWWLGPQAVLLIAACLYAVAALPLLRTAEPVKTKQKLRFEGMPWRSTWRSYTSNVSAGVDATTATLLWPLFLAAVLFAGSDDSVYAKVGGLASISLITTFAASWTFGKIIDRRRGKDLLTHATMAVSLAHLARPLATTPLSVGLINVISDTSATGYMMAYTRGQYDLADRSGHRNAYLFLADLSWNFGMFLMFVIVFAISSFSDDLLTIFTISFVACSLLCLNIMRARFPLYKWWWIV